MRNAARFLVCILSTVLLTGLLPSSSALADTTIVIVRHGEKPEQGLGQLTCRGLNRALGLAPVLLSRYGKPVAIYAPNPAAKKMDKGVAYAYVRPLATIEPLAVRVGLPVNVDWGMAEIGPLADALQARTEGTQVVAWEHHYAEKLAKHLLEIAGGNPAEVPVWDDADFDSIYVVRISGQDKQRKAVFAHENEGLNNQPANCSP